jgi:hypothetical protein
MSFKKIFKAMYFNYAHKKNSPWPQAAVACRAALAQPCPPPAPPALALAVFVLSQTLPSPSSSLSSSSFVSASFASLIACTSMRPFVLLFFFFWALPEPHM